VGSLTSRLLSGSGHRAAKDAAPAAFGTRAGIGRNSNVRQEKSLEHVDAIAGLGRM
jgi:hypothetical protein